ncbi:zinc finger domain-containing protein [Actinomadura nitritigenes]|uniref:zinc finger domain-containing protein n=1 Tax=Actinomadura nitritigenes TaxID=134602 RepID=UPI003D8B9D0B
MNAAEAAQLLAHCAAFDNRKASAAASQAWAAALRDVPLDADALEAVARYYGTEDPDATGQRWIQPHHVRTHRRAIREGRLAALPLPAPPAELARDEAAYRDALLQITRQVADGRVPFRAIAGGRGAGRASGAEPSTAYRTTRSPEDRDRVLAQSVPCPVEWCPARAGEPCRSAPDRPAMRRWHPSRLAAARRNEAS